MGKQHRLIYAIRQNRTACCCRPKRDLDSNQKRSEKISCSSSAVEPGRPFLARLVPILQRTECSAALGRDELHRRAAASLLLLKAKGGRFSHSPELRI